jgi:hypothetical protein
MANNIRKALEAADQHRVAQRQHIPKTLPTREYAKWLQNHCQPLRYAERLLKHMAPQWEEGVRDWSKLVEKQTTPNVSAQIQILHATTVDAKLRSGDKSQPNPKLKTTLSTLAATLALPTSHEHHKLPKNSTSQTQIIHATWHEHIALNNLPTTKTSNFGGNHHSP